MKGLKKQSSILVSEKVRFPSVVGTISFSELRTSLIEGCIKWNIIYTHTTKSVYIYICMYVYSYMYMYVWLESKPIQGQVEIVRCPHCRYTNVVFETDKSVLFIDFRGVLIERFHVHTAVYYVCMHSHNTSK